MANRSGALNEIEYSEFIQKIQTFADAIGAEVDFPDMLEVVARARELDAFAGEHDAQLAVQAACPRRGLEPRLYPAAGGAAGPGAGSAAGPAGAARQRMPARRRCWC